MGLKNRTAMTEETYIRMLPYSVIKYTSSILDIDEKWRRLVVEIPKRLQDVGCKQTEIIEKRYSQLQVRLFEEKSKRPDGSPTKSILDDWGTQNTKVKHLIRVLQESALYEAADYISVNVLKGEKVPRLHNNEASNGALPTPQWDAPVKAKKMADEQKPEPIACSNFDNVTDKKLYEKEKICQSNGDISAASSDETYNTLVKESKDEGPYNQLSTDGGPDRIIYNRITSFDSGGQPSVLLKTDNVRAKECEYGGEEHAETVQVRPIEMDTDLKKQMVPIANKKESPSREPCETSDNTDSGMDDNTPYDIYALSSQVMEFRVLALITDNFNSTPFGKGGRVIGSGGFGDVFLGIFKNQYKVAVKRLKDVDEVEKQFTTELDALCKYRHTNIVKLHGYSIDGPGKCLVYEYLCNGSLEDRLVRKDDTPPLKNSVRVSILQGTAEGIYFLNCRGIVHRDIKSANVLLDIDFTPKVGDFATARGGPRGRGTTAMSTQVVIGTSAYLAPEALNFDVSTKLDSYSFGIVVLEVLTSLQPLDHTREEKDLKSHVEDNDIHKIIDTSGGQWDESVVTMLRSISDKCTERRKKQRANVENILPDLRTLYVKDNC